MREYKPQINQLQATVMQHPEILPSASPNSHFGRYTLLYRFATGGMASIYLARLTGEDGFQRLVAVKVIHEHLTEQPEFVKMFIDEARLASRISHPNVVLTLDLGRVGKTHFIAMEYVDGESLAAVLKKMRPSLAISARIIADAAAGLHAAHELRGDDGELLHVVHRDVSPQNILISYDGAIKVVDFGVARARGSLHITTGEVKGKFCYMSPEQFTAPEKVDRRSDIFSLGTVLYEMTTRRRLFKAENEAETVHKVLYHPIVPPSQVIANYPPELEAIVLRALARDPECRFQTTLEMQEALEHVIANSGKPMLAAAIGKMMTQAFADRIQKKRALLQNSDSTPIGIVPRVDMVSKSSIIMGVGTETKKSRKQKIGLAFLGLGSVLGGALLVKTLFFRGGVLPQPITPPSPIVSSRPSGGQQLNDALSPVRYISISAKALPQNANITFDGKSVSNPFELRRPVGEGTSELAFFAPGYVSQRIVVSLTQGGTWEIKLKPKSRVNSIGKSLKKNASSVKDRHKLLSEGKKKQGNDSTGQPVLTDDEVLANPYNRSKSR